jgi:23S rRNA (uridine2552-2'-O)-methyltransferase
MKRTRTSKAWMQEHVNDAFVKQAQKDGFRSRAAYKLMEIHEKYKLIKPGMKVVDFGSSPGSWSQVVAKLLQGKGHIIAMDLLPMDPIPRVDFIQGDFREEASLRELETYLNNSAIDLVISDMAPNITGIKTVDQPGVMHLTELALDFSLQWLKPSGHFLVKTFIGADFDELVKKMRPEFEKVITVKPKASRDRSSEVYLLGFAKV